MSELNRPRPGNLRLTDEQIEQSLQGHFRQMRERGIDKLIFTPRASGMGHEVGSELTSRYWTEVNNNLIDRACKLFPDKLIPGCMLPQSPGISPKNCIPELERCVMEHGAVVCNINPDVSGGGQPFTPSLGSEWWYPLWEKMVELDVPCTVHASGSQNPAMHTTNAYYIAHHNSAAVELLKSRVFKDFPKLKIVIPHGGG